MNGWFGRMGFDIAITRKKNFLRVQLHLVFSKIFLFKALQDLLPFLTFL